ncbi:uncharacterized protein LOC125576645 isoform X1 [Brassica napus]|uniref:uncharacterized protein LOC125576645 isoform X1 n=2 Tax=Brassica napus TaxID=3708 RepID=UPI00207881DE|nr:uncharacterized protein LOC125576645 isoform X1 [Brassica napus]
MEKAVCNHGFFMMAPNVWDPKSKSLTRPMTVSNSSSVSVTISHPRTLSFLVIQVHGINNVSRVDEELILQQVGRMLRISDEDGRDVTEFQQLHEDAKKYGFGRIFRSPFLFEDMVKSILLSNITWERTLGACKCGMFERDARDSSTILLRQILSIPVFSLLVCF